MEKKLENAFAEILRRYRETADLSRTGLASLVGLDGSYIHRLEMGNRRPSRDTVIAMAEALDLDASDTNRWLAAAGHGALPISDEVGSIRHERGLNVNKDPSTRANAVRWGTKLEAIGLEEATLRRLIQAIEVAPAKERRRISTLVSTTLRLLTEGLEAPVHMAVIPAAGGSHRPLADVMQRLIVRAIGEAIECGIHQIVLVLAPEMEQSFYTPLCESLDLTGVGMVDLRCVIQPLPDGLGSAILKAEEHVGEQPFAVLLPDDVLNTRENRLAKIRQLQMMVDALGKLKGANLLAVTPVSKRKMRQYGIVQLADGLTAGTYPVLQLIEKPETTDSIVNLPNTVGIVGRYILQPEIFGALRTVQKLGGRRLELTAALEYLRKSKREIRAVPLKGARKDLGEILGQATDLIDA